MKKLDKKQKNKIKAAAAAAVTAAGVAVGGSFSSPADIMNSCDDDDAAFTQSLGEDSEEKTKKGVNAQIRKQVSRWNPALKAFVAVPLWGVGWVIINLVSVLYSAVLSPVLSTVLTWLLIAAFAVAVFALAVKTVFPELPLKKILNKRSIGTIVVLVFVFSIADTLLLAFCDGYIAVSRAVKLGASLIATAVPVVFFVKRKNSEDRKAEENESVLPEESEEEKSRRLVTELADSVCRPRY